MTTDTAKQQVTLPTSIGATRGFSALSKRLVATCVTGVMVLAACGGSNETGSATVTEAATPSQDATTEEATTTKAPRPTTTAPATTTTVLKTGTRVAADCAATQDFDDDDGDTYGECVDRVLPLDAAGVQNEAAANGMPASEAALCPIPATLVDGETAVIRCDVIGPDQSEGVWTFTVTSAGTLPAAPVYTQTKAAPLSRATCQETPPDGQFQKDSTATRGRCLHFWANVFQFDANTGPCSFLGNYGSQPYNRSYEFSGATIRINSDVSGNCALMEPVVQGSLVEVWAVNEGTESYSTTIGGTNTYTKFTVVDIVVYG